MNERTSLTKRSRLGSSRGIPAFAAVLLAGSIWAGASERRNKFLRPAEQRELCADCHGFEALWRFLYYHEDQRNPHPERKINPLSVDTKP
jgi:hypothetical protein